MLVPEIIFQNSKRWLIVTKPKGWTMTKRDSNPRASLEKFLAPIISESSKVFFPYECDSRMNALVVACSDRGMQSQFERFKIRREISFTYRCVVHHAPTNKDDEWFSIGNVSEIKHGIFEADVSIREPQTMAKLEKIIGLSIINGNVSLFKLSFPDPLKHELDEVSIIVPPNPAGGWEL
jgi:hypothetical protein